MGAATLFVVDDDPKIAKSLTKLAGSVSLPIEVFRHGEEFLRGVAPDRHGCLILEVRLPHITGIEIQRAMKAHPMCMPIIVLTGYGDVPTAVKMLTAGAFDFVEKPYQDHALLETIYAAIRKNAQSHEWYARKLEMEARLATLTPGERDVLEGIMQGCGYKTIAKDLNISYKTVQARRDQIMKKIGTVDLPNLLHRIMESRLAKPA